MGFFFFFLEVVLWKGQILCFVQDQHAFHKQHEKIK